MAQEETTKMAQEASQWTTKTQQSSLLNNRMAYMPTYLGMKAKDVIQDGMTIASPDDDVMVCSE
eukprot:CAMPEP_0202493880 /NCGR_PEP_ID=MMETSP1361-20130828/10043_1 /ASSEMBLY_ACC=CAM_ASM_000849 /TAXON_ID=210615 /ORGANISM="Staurosira complex sp., Strain CCMP2646" /LENGTH=63 /DNA_ID=CAMNT_0049124241 /DNA_START=1808 /DNA_END=1999 /DNA_ORIENTATION=+